MTLTTEWLERLPRRNARCTREYLIMDWFTLGIICVLALFYGGVLLFAWLMLKVISD